MEKSVYILLFVVLAFACDGKEEAGLIDFYPGEDAPFDVPVLEWGKDTAYIITRISNEYAHKDTQIKGDDKEYVILCFKRNTPREGHYQDEVSYTFFEEKLQSIEINYTTHIAEGYKQCKEYFTQKLGEGFDERQDKWRTPEMIILLSDKSNDNRVNLFFISYGNS